MKHWDVIVARWNKAREKAWRAVAAAALGLARVFAAMARPLPAITRTLEGAHRSLERMSRWAQARARRLPVWAELAIAKESWTAPPPAASRVSPPPIPVSARKTPKVMPAVDEDELEWQARLAAAKAAPAERARTAA
jgi:hypothetical protein